MNQEFKGVGTLVVTTLVDEDDGGSGGTGLSLREAISMASDGDTIIFDPSLNNGINTNGVITLSLGELRINKSININGDLDDDDSTRDITVDADGKSRVFRINDGISVNVSTVGIDGLTITGGSSIDRGGGIYNDFESLNLTNSTISGNSANRAGAGIYNYVGTINITDSTISGNEARRGGGISNVAGTISINNSTLSGNSAQSGGGIHNTTYCYESGYVVGIVEIENSTISGN